MAGKKVAVIGAGASGLTAIKCAVEEGFDVVCFEQEGVIGGLWHYTDKDTHSSVCKSTIINTSKEMMSYSDFPPPEDFPVYMHNTKLIEYLTMYAEKFDLLKYVKFNTKIKIIKRSPDHEETGKWDITYFPVGKETVGQKMETFDFVFVCTGHHWQTKIPDFEGSENFQGIKIHSKSYKDFKPFEDKVVVIVGIGNSGGDIAVELSRHARKVYLSTRRGFWIFPRMTAYGYPGDQYVHRRVFNMLPQFIIEKFSESDANKHFHHEKYGLKPNHSIFAQNPMINDDLPLRMEAGKLTVKPNIKYIKQRSVVFEDDNEVSNVDAIIFATGYKIDFPCLEEGLIEVDKNKVPLYKYVFPYNHSKHTMAIIGCVAPLGALMPISELQARWVSQVFNGKRALPSAEVMKAEVQKKVDNMAKKYFRGVNHMIEVSYIGYADELAAEIGCKPNLIKLFFKDPCFAFKCFFGPCAPYQYRITGPNSWSGAKQALEALEENNMIPTRTGVVKSDKNSNWSLETVLFIIAFIVFFSAFIFAFF